MVYPKTTKENEMPVAYQRPGTYTRRFVCNTVIPFWNFNEFRALTNVSLLSHFLLGDILVFDKFVNNFCLPNNVCGIMTTNACL